MKNAARVGFFLIVFVALIVGAFEVLGKSIFARRHRIYYAKLTDAGGLANGSKVLMAGVQIGEVHQVSLIDPHHAQLTLSLHEQTRLPIGSMAVIPSSLVSFGESQLMIVAPDEVTGYLPDGATIGGKKSGPLDSLLPDGGKSMVSNIDKSLESLRKLLQDQGLQKDVKKLVETTSDTLVASQASLKRFDTLADSAKGLIVSNQGNLHQILVGAQATVLQAHELAGALTKFIQDGKFQGRTNELLAKAGQIEDHSNEFLVKLNKIANDPTILQNLKTSSANIAATTDKGPKIAESAEKITANMVDITDKSKDLPGKISAVADKTIELENSINKLVDKFNSVKAPSTEGFKDIEVEADLTHETNPSYWRTDLNLLYPLKKGYVTFGVYDAFESNKINLQLARSFGHMDLRYGIYASTVGVGVDYNITRKLKLRTDLFDINSLELDARLRYDLGGGVVGWAGFDRVFDRNLSFNFGLGFKE